MNIIIVGCGRIGADLAFRLFKQGHQVTIIDNILQSFERLNPEFRGRTIEGEALSKDVLERANIEKADGLAVVTNSDTLNAVVAHIARTLYKITNIVVRNYDPNLRPVLEAFGFQLVSSTAWGAQRTEELLTSEMQRAVFSPGNGEVEVYELYIPKHLNGQRLFDLMGKVNNCLPIALTRAGKSSLPNQDTLVATGDMLAVSATAEGISCLRQAIIEKEG
jgi:trk system potassium uptake protein TrkA